MSARCALVLAVVSLAALAAAENVFPDDYPAFWESAPPYSMACESALPRLGLARASPIGEYEDAQLSEAGGFGGPLSHARNARKEIGEAKESSTISFYGIARLPLYESYAYSLLVVPGSVLGGFAGGPPGAVVASVSCASAALDMPIESLPLPCRDAKRASCDGMAHAARAVAEASRAAEEARAIALEESGELARMGALCDGFFGPEKAVAEQAARGLSLSPDAGEPPVSEAVSRAWALRESFAGGTVGSEDAGAYADAFNLLAGSGGLVSRFSRITVSVRAAKKTMLESLEAESSAFEAVRDEAETEASRLAREGYLKIDAKAFSGLGGAAETAVGASAASPPSETVRQAEEALRRAERLHSESAALSGSAENCRVSRALEKISEARRNAEAALGSCRQAEAEVEERLSRAEAELAGSVRETRARADALGSSQPFPAQLKARVAALLAAAEEKIEGARFSTAGGKAEAFAGASALVSSASGLLGEGGLALAGSAFRANESLRELAALSEKAEKDGLDSGLEKRFVLEADASLPLAGAEDLAAIELRARSLCEALYGKAEARFAPLSARLAKLSEFSGEAEAYASISGETAAVLESAQAVREIGRDYVAGGRIDARLALGHYLEIERRLGEAENAFSSEKARLLSRALQDSARVRCIPVLSATAGAKAAKRSQVALENRFGFGSDGAVEVSFPDPCAMRSLNFSGDGFALLHSDGETVAAVIAGVAPRAAYSAEMGGEEFVPVRHLGTVFAEPRVSPGALEGAATVSLEASEGVGLLTLQIPLQPQPPTYSGAAENGELQSIRQFPGGLEAVISGVRKGAASLKISYAYPAPYELRLGNRSLERLGNASYVSCANATVSASMRLPGFNATIYLANASPQDCMASVEDEGGPVASTVFGAAGGSAVAWQVPQMASGETRAYAVCHRFTNASEYAAALLLEAEEKESLLAASGLLTAGERGQLGDAVSQGREKLEAGTPAKAVPLLLDAVGMEEALEAAVEARALARSAFQSASGEFLESRNQSVSAFTAFREHGFTGEAAAESSLLSAADSLSSHAGALAAAGDYASAAEKMREARSTLSQAGIAATLSQKADALAEEIGAAEESASPLRFYGFAAPDEAREARELLESAQASLQDGDLAAAAKSLREAASKAKNASEELGGQYAEAEAMLESAEASFRKTGPRAASALEELGLASTLTGASEPAKNSAASGLGGNGSFAGLREKLDALSGLFSAWSSARDRRAFIASHAESASRAKAEADAANASLAEMQGLLARYESLAESTLEDASLKEMQAEALVYGQPEFAGELASINGSVASARSAFGEGRFADSIAGSESSISSSARLLAAASQLAARKQGGFEVTPLHLVIPAILLSLAFAYARGRRKTAAPPRRLQKPPGQFPSP
ncbi:MAG: hypothetical protein PHF51_05245 [Candidatus ainarchaeum sp.]|nr:hypothetical protein [Candidatus ainarchaeum sp.]